MAVAAFSRGVARKLRHRGGPINWDSHLPHSPLFSTAAAPAISSFSQNQPPEKDKRSTWSKIFLFVPGAITFCLGTWQIFRRKEKIEMLEYRRNRLGMEPLKCNEVTHSSEDLNHLEFRKVKCRGIFNEKKSVFVGPRSRSISGVTENGYYVITPLEPVSDDLESTQSAILVNRGWVPRSWRDKSLEEPESDSQPPIAESFSPSEDEKSSSWWRLWSKKPKKIQQEEAPSVIAPDEVVGVIRGSEKPSIFVPANDPNSHQWFFVDVPAIARACGYPENTLYIESVNDNVDPSNPYPVPKDLNTLVRSSVMPQDHLNYMLTWYSLSAAVTFMAFKRLKPKKGRR